MQMSEVSHVWMHHQMNELGVTHMNASSNEWVKCHTYECIIKWMSEVSHIWMHHQMNEWRGPPFFLSDGDPRLLTSKTVWNFWDSRGNLFERYGDFCEDLLKFWRSQFFYVRSPRSVVWMRHFTHVNDPYLCGRYGSFTCVKWRIHTRKWPISATHVNDPYLPHMWMRHFTHVNDPYLTHMWMDHTTPMNASCHTNQKCLDKVEEAVKCYTKATAHTCVRRVTRMNELCHTYEWVRSHIWISHITQMNKSYHT